MPWALAAVWLVACSGGGDASRFDARVRDAALIDGEPPDGGAVDGGVIDGASVDGPTADAVVADATFMDAAVEDAAAMDAAVSDAPAMDAAVVDAVPGDSAPVDGAAIDGAIDGALADATVDAPPLPLGQRAVWTNWAFSGVSFHDYELEIAATRSSGRVVFTYQDYWTRRIQVFGCSRAGLEARTVHLVRDLYDLGSDGAGTVLTIGVDYLGGRFLNVIEAATATSIDSMPVGLDSLDVRHAVRHGDGFLIADRTSAWRIDAIGAVVAVVPLGDLYPRYFVRDGSQRLLTTHSANAVVWLDLGTGTRTPVAVPPGLSGLRFHGIKDGRHPWISGDDTAGRVVVAPLGSVVGTVLPQPGVAMAVDPAGRLLVAWPSAGTRELSAIRLEPIDDEVRQDPTFGDGGIATLAACLTTCPERHDVMIDAIEVASDGGLLVLERQHTLSEYNHYLWWFDAP